MMYVERTSYTSRWRHYSDCQTRQSQSTSVCYDCRGPSTRTSRCLEMSRPSKSCPMNTVYVCRSVCPSVRLSVRLFVCPSVCLSVCSSVCPSVRLFRCPSVCLSVCLSVQVLSDKHRVCLCLCLSACLLDDDHNNDDNCNYK